MRRGAGLVDTPAQDTGTRRLDVATDGEVLVSAFDGTRPGHHDDLLPADSHPSSELQTRALRLDIPRSELVRLHDGHNAVHTGQTPQCLDLLLGLVTDDGHDGLLHPIDRMRRETEVGDLVNHRLDRAFVGIGSHDDDHRRCPLLGPIRSWLDAWRTRWRAR